MFSRRYTMNMCWAIKMKYYIIFESGKSLRLRKPEALFTIKEIKHMDRKKQKRRHEGNGGHFTFERQYTTAHTQCAFC